MSERNESQDKLVEYLWAEINRAILKSRDVRTTIQHLKDRGLLDQICDYNLVLDVRKLVELTLDIDDDDMITLAPEGSTEKKGELANPLPFFLDSEEEDAEKEASSSSGKWERELDRLDRETHRPKKDASRDRGPQIDGQPLSSNEILFQQYLEKQFDEESWMKQAGIRFP